MSCSSQLQNAAVPIIGGVRISDLNNNPNILEDDLFVFADESAESNYNINLSQLRNSILGLTNAGDLLSYNGSNYTRVAIGSAGQYLTNSGGNLIWQDLPEGISDVLTTNGDLLYYNSGDYQRLPVGSSNQVLTVSGGLPSWQDKDFYEDPLSAAGDLVYRSVSNSTTRLPAGITNQYLRIGSSGVPEWSNISGYSSPLTTLGDILYHRGGILGEGRLAVGSEGQVLRVTSGIPSWESIVEYIDPLITNGDILTRVAGNTTRLGIGSTNQVLTVIGGYPSWQDIPAQGFSYPLTTTGDLMYDVSGTPTRLPIGTEGYLLVSVSGIPQWVDINSAIQIFGTPNQIDVIGDAISISSNPIIPGTDSLTLPIGTTAQRGTGVNGKIRYNSSNNKFEAYEAGDWKDVITTATGTTIGVNQIAYGNSDGDIVSSSNLLYSGGNLLVGGNTVLTNNLIGTSIQAFYDNLESIGTLSDTEGFLYNDGAGNFSYEELGSAAVLNAGTLAGNVPVLNVSGKLEPSILPDLAISEFQGNFADLTAALADAGVNASQRGDWFTVDDDGSGSGASYIVTTDSPTLSGYVTKLKTPTGGFTVTGGVNNGVITYDSSTGQGVIESGLTYSGSLLQVTGTGQFTSVGEPLRLRYNSSNYIRFLVSSQGVVTYGAIGTNPSHNFNNTPVTNISILGLTEQSSDSDDPSEGESRIWQSNGVGSGDDGDILIKRTFGGTTYTDEIGIVKEGSFSPTYISSNVTYSVNVGEYHRVGNRVSCIFRIGLLSSGSDSAVQAEFDQSSLPYTPAVFSSIAHYVGYGTREGFGMFFFNSSDYLLRKVDGTDVLYSDVTGAQTAVFTLEYRTNDPF